MKRTLLAIVPLACLSTAAEAHLDQHHFDGIYVGGKVGISNTFANVDTSTKATYNTFFISTPVQPGQSTSNRSALLGHIFGAGGINVGYGKQLSNSQVYLGAELAANVATKEVTLSDSSTNALTFKFIPSFTSNSLSGQTKAQLNTFEIDIDFKPGMVVGPDTLIFGRIGAALNKIQTTSKDTLVMIANSSDAPSSTPSTTNILNISKQNTVAGLRLGFGGEYRISCRVTATADYLYTWYGNAPNLSGTANVTNINPLPPTTVTVNGLSSHTTASMYTQAFMLGLNYYFNEPV